MVTSKWEMGRGDGYSSDVSQINILNVNLGGNIFKRRKWSAGVNHMKM